MDEKKDRGALFHELELMAAAYPGYRWESRHAQAYWIVLQLFSLTDVVEGIRAAQRLNATRLPTAGEIREQALVIERQRATREEAEAKRRAEEAEARLYHNPAPTDPERQTAYIASAMDPFEALARRWEAQSLRLELEPGKPCPRNVGAERLSQFWEAWQLATGESKKVA